MSAEAPKPSLDQLLDEIDHDRALANDAAVAASLRQQQAKEKALQEAWDKTRSLEIAIKDYLAVADPVITEGLSKIARKTWGADGFIIITYGPSWDKTGSYVTSSDFQTIVDPEAAKPPPLEYLSGAEFHYYAQGVDRSKIPFYDPDASYYEATLKFRDGKPHSLQFGDGMTLYEQELARIGEENALNHALAEYYRHGPEANTYSGES